MHVSTPARPHPADLSPPQAQVGDAGGAPGEAEAPRSPEAQNASTAADDLLRAGEIVRFLLKYRSAGVLHRLAGSDTDAAADLPPVAGEPERFVADLEAMGPAFVKIGQGLSTRPDMVHPAYLEALQRLQDDATPIDVEHVRSIVEEELGARIGHLFQSFDIEPLGVASLAQVHRAVLRDGREVAVKVQRPGMGRQIRDDLSALASLADKADRFTGGDTVRLAEWVRELRKSLLAELDYRSEAESLERFAQRLTPYPELIVPQPLWDLCTDRVITMTMVRGTKATELSPLRRLERPMAGLASSLLQGYLDQVFVHGDIHADPHPGNVLVTDDNRLALLDLGMVAHVPPRQRERLLKMLFAAVDGRGEDVAREVVGMGTRTPGFDEATHQRDVAHLVSRYCVARPGTASSEGRLVLDLVMIGHRCGLRIAPELSLLGKTLLNLEAVSHALDPRLDARAVVRDHLESIMTQRLKLALSPARLASQAMELQALVRETPRKLADVMSLLADNRLQIRIAGLEDSQLIEGIQKVANRISTGLIAAALIIASALLMQFDVGPSLLGYPAIALLAFGGAAALGVGIIVSAWWRDRHAKPVETRAPG